MKKLDPREFGLNDNASSPAESARVSGRFYTGIFSGAKKKKKLALVSAIFIVILFIFLVFISFFPPFPLPKKQAAQSQPAIVLMPSSAPQRSVAIKDQLFYTDQDGLFSYDMVGGNTRQIATINGSSSILKGQRIDSDTIGFEVGVAGTYTSVVYVLDLATNVLTKKADIGTSSWFIDDLNFISPDEFIYAEGNASATMIDNYEHVFLFNNGTTTEIGYISNPGEYGSTIGHSPDGKHIFFANQIYNIGSGSWKPIYGKCKGVQSAWLNNDVVVLKGLSDWNVGVTCYYNIVSGKERNVGLTEGFAVMGNHIVYEQTATTTPSLFYIWDYDYNTRTSHIVVPGGQMYPYYEFDMNDLAGVIYQPTISSGTCMDLGCWGGTASGSLMMLDLATGSSTSLNFDLANKTYTTVF